MPLDRGSAARFTGGLVARPAGARADSQLRALLCVMPRLVRHAVHYAEFREPGASIEH